MELADLQSLVEQNAEWFRGVQHETADTIADAERQLGQALPLSLSWLLTNWGYSGVCGVDSLQDTVANTLRVREAMQLPERYIVLNDWHDGGIVLFDTSTPKPGNEYPVLWTGTHNVHRLAIGETMDDDVDVFPDYPAWAVFRLEEASEKNT